VSEVNPFALMLFGGEPVFNDHTKQLEVGNWAMFHCPSGQQILPLIKAARIAVQKVLATKLDDLKHDLSSSKELKACVQLLKSNGLGYRKPSPSPMLRSRKPKEADEFDEWQNEVAYMEKKDKELAIQAFEKYRLDIPKGTGYFDLKDPTTYEAPPP